MILGCFWHDQLIPTVHNGKNSRQGLFHGPITWGLVLRRVPLWVSMFCGCHLRLLGMLECSEQQTRLLWLSRGLGQMGWEASMEGGDVSSSQPKLPSLGWFICILLCIHLHATFWKGLTFFSRCSSLTSRVSILKGGGDPPQALLGALGETEKLENLKNRCLSCHLILCNSNEHFLDWIVKCNKKWILYNSQW